MDVEFPLIYSGRSSKMFDFDNNKVLSLYNVATITEKILVMKRALKSKVKMPATLDVGFNIITEEYIDFEFPDFCVHSNKLPEIAKMLNNIYSQFDAREISLKEYLNKIHPFHASAFLRRNKDLKFDPNETIVLVNSHSDFHLGNLPEYKGELYLLDLEAFSYKPLLYDLFYFSFLPSVENFKYYIPKSLEFFSKCLVESKFLSKFDPSFESKKELYTALSASMFRVWFVPLQNFFDKWLHSLILSKKNL